MKSKKISAAFLLAAVVSGFAVEVFACGPDFPNNLLAGGDDAVLQPPVADFQHELARVKLVTTRFRAVPHIGPDFYNQSSEVEMTDLAAALKREKISSELTVVIMQAHLAERMKLNAFLDAQYKWQHFRGWIFETNGYHDAPNTNSPPAFPTIAVTPGLPPEFASYFAGAVAWHNEEKWTAAERWQQVLALPEAERHFKSTWAAFMLGKYQAQLTNDASDNEALKYFHQVQSLAKQGFADSAGLAVASIGDEARIFLRQENYERALELYLEQFAAGDRTALDSLRFSAAAVFGENGAMPSQLLGLAKNPRTRRVLTAWLISRHPYNDRVEIVNDPNPKKFFKSVDRWLAAVESANVKDVESAEQLALAAYQAGNMDAAQRWVGRAGNSAVTRWLQAKLYLRAGKTDAAAKFLVQVSREFPQVLPGTNAPKNFAESLFVDLNPLWNEDIAVGRQALGELGVLRLARRDYVEALDALLRSGYWMDAAYVAERVLTTGELKIYIDRNWPTRTALRRDLEIMTGGDFASEPFNPREKIRWLLARRLAREAGSRDAQIYFPSNFADAYGKYLAGLRTGRDENFKTEVRAANLFAAAVMARTNGMELFGTELEPDFAIHDGQYEYGFTWMDRATNSLDAKINLADADEIARASSHFTIPDERFHYRWQAAALAWEAAQLMPDNSDDTARVLCTAGTWLKNRDPEAADKFYKALVRRCRKTALGQQADVLRWFPAQNIGGGKPRLETIEITADLTNAVSSSPENIFSTEFPVPGRKYVVHADEDVYVIARAVQRLGFQMTVDEILEANPGLKHGPIEVGQLIMIPEKPAR